MDNLCSLMTGDYRSLCSRNESIVRDNGWDSEEIATAGFASGASKDEVTIEQEFLNQIDNPSDDPADIIEDYEDAVEKISIRERQEIRAKNNRLAFERYVAECCGIEV